MIVQEPILTFCDAEAHRGQLVHAVWPVQKTWLGLAKCPGKHGSCIPWIWSSCMTEWNNFMNSHGDVANLKGRQVNWYTLPFTLKQRYFHTARCIGNWRYASCRSIETVHLPSHMDTRREALVSLWKCCITRGLLRWEKSMTGYISSLIFCRTSNSQLKNPCDCSWHRGLMTPLSNSWSTTCWKFLVTVPLPKCEWFLDEERSCVTLGPNLIPESSMPGSHPGDLAIRGQGEPLASDPLPLGRLFIWSTMASFLSRGIILLGL